MAKKVSKVYQFKISLKATDSFGYAPEGENPDIWRRIQVPENYNFRDFHLAINQAMGWDDSHLHQFLIVNPKTRYTDKIGVIDDDDSDLIPEDKVKIKQYFISPQDAATYKYDFNDGWMHDINLEKILPAVEGRRYPKCIGGKMACPPEDCGGIYGYKELLRILADPKHEEYKEHVKWLKSINRKNFDPKEFKPKLVKFSHSIKI